MEIRVNPQPTRHKRAGPITCTEAFGHCATSTGQKFEPKVRTKATASEFASYNLCEDADISAQKYTLAYTNNNKNLTKTYLDRDLMKVIEVEAPIEYNTRQRTTNKNTTDTVKQRRELKKETSNLVSNLTDKLIKPKDTVRKIIRPSKFN